MEFCVYPLFSPQSLLAEGTANFGVEMVFPTMEERIRFEEQHLFPLAGLSPHLAREHYEVESLVHGLDYVTNEAARRLVNGEYTEAETVAYLSSFLSSPERATKRVSFIKAYRSYVINYNLGMDLVRRHVELCVEERLKNEVALEESDTEEKRAAKVLAARWAEFIRLLSEPYMPSMLRA